MVYKPRKIHFIVAARSSQELLKSHSSIVPHASQTVPQRTKFPHFRHLTTENGKVAEIQ